MQSLTTGLMSGMWATRPSPPMSFWALPLLITLCGVLFSLTYLRCRRHDQRLPPCPWRFPLLGNLHLLGSLPHQDLHRLAKKHGPIMYMQLGLVPAVMVSSPEAAELFLKTHDLVFASRPSIQAIQYISYGRKGVAFTEYSPYWHSIRKLCSIELLSSSKIKMFKPIRKEELGLLVRSLKVDSDFKAMVDLSSKLKDLVQDVTYRMVLGCSRGAKSFEFFETTEKAMKLAGAFNIADFIPFVGALDLQGVTHSNSHLQGLNCRAKAINKVFDQFLEKMIDEHVKKAAGNQSGQHRDFNIDVMLSLMRETQVGEHEIQYNVDWTNIKAILIDMLAAATDTSLTAIEWALSELFRHPSAMKKLQEELSTVVGIGQIVEETDLGKLGYLDMVVKETMRLHQVVPLLVLHESMEDITINRMFIPKNSRIIVNAWSIGRDMEAWSANADEFFPERFMGSNVDLRGCHFQLIPFGRGRRGCPGLQVGLTLVQLVLAQLLHCFNWQLPNGVSPSHLDMSEKFGLATTRASHLFAIPSYRLHFNNL